MDSGGRLWTRVEGAILGVMSGPTVKYRERIWDGYREMAEAINMPFRLCTQVGPNNHE